MDRRRDYRKFKEVLKEYRISRFYHFTDRSNLTSIINSRGLFSWARCEEHNINVPKPGGSELSHFLDAKVSLDRYVRISICHHHPMMYLAVSDGRIINPVILEIDPDVLFIEGNIFSDKNANRNDAEMGASFESFMNIHFSTALQPSQFNVDECERPYYQAEILVKDFIPLYYILNISDFNNIRLDN